MSDNATSQDNPAHIGATRRLKIILDMLARQQSASAPEADWPDSTGDRPSVANDHGDDDDTQKSRGPTATLGQLIDALDERAYGLMLLLLALPCCLPFVYILPQIVALPMLALSAQMALGREAPWLPAKLSKREFQIASMQSTVSRAERYLGWAERLSHSRFRAVSSGPGARIVGALLLIPCASILVPLPLTNTTPGIAVAIVALGLIERDGLLIIAGLILGLSWVFILVFLGAEAISFAKDWVLGLF